MNEDNNKQAETPREKPVAAESENEFVKFFALCLSAFAVAFVLFATFVLGVCFMGRR